MVSLLWLFDLVGAIGFLIAAVIALRLYLDRPLVRNYWFSWTVAVLHLALWSLASLLGRLGVAPVVFDSVVPLLLLTVGLTALMHIALYDNTGSEGVLRQLRTSEALNRAVLANYPDGAVVLFDDELTAVTAGGDDLPGYDGPAGEIEGTALLQALPESVTATVDPPCRAALAGETSSFDFSYDGSAYEARALPVETDPADRPVDGDRAPQRLALLVVRDVTERNRRERQLRDQRDRLSALDRINRVVRDVDHALVGADSRAEVARAVADRLAADDPYRAVAVAWLAEDDLVPAVWGGVEPETASGAFPAPTGQDASNVGARALETGETQVVRDVGADGGSVAQERGRGTGADPWRRSARAVGANAIALVPVRHADRRLGVLAVYADRRDAFESQELAVLDQFGETVGHAVVALERRERVAVLAALHRVTRDLLHATTTEAVYDVVVEAGTDLLGVDVALLEYDEGEHCLRRSVASGPLSDGLAASIESGGDDGAIPWQTFASGESRVAGAPTCADVFDGTETDVRSAMFVPLGEHGVLVAGTAEPGAFDERRRQLVDLLAATTEAALDRLDNEADLREREATLRDRNARLRRLQRLNDVIRDVDQALVGATSRAEVEAAVCDRLTADDRFAFAWIGTFERDGVGIERRAWSGDADAYFETVSFDAEVTSSEPAMETFESGELTVVDSLANLDRSADWVSWGLDAGFASALSVPIAFHDIDYGALTVYASRPNAFDEQTTTVLAELADTIAYGINARETKRGLLASGGTELKLVIREADSVLNELADLAEGPLRVVETRPGSGDTTEIRFVAPGASLSALRERCETLRIDAVDPVSDRPDEQTFRATMSGPVLSVEIVELGAIPREIEATADETTAVVLLLPQVDAREFVERLRERYPSVELLARRECDARTLSRGAFLDEFESLVTERQLEVLRTAYESGYFDRPRASSGQDVADLLDVSQPTVNYHLRESQHRLLSLLFGDADDGSRDGASDDAEAE